jgi:hypothetical protein
VSAVSANAVDTYELMRAAVLRADPDAGPNLDVLRREGLTAWSRRLIVTPNVGPPPPDPVRRLPAWPGNTADEISELTRLIAGIVLAITAEPAHV